MDWMKFYKKWSTEVGSTIKEDVFLAWQAFVADAEETVMVKAIEEIAEWYNAKKQRSDSYVANITLYQLRDAYNRAYREAHPAQSTKCAKCEGERYVHVVDNGKYFDPDFPPPPGTPTRSGGTCAIPCPVCCCEQYGSNAGLRSRVFDRCRPTSRREELYATAEVTA